MTSNKVASIFVLSQKFVILIILISLPLIYLGTRHEYVASEMTLSGHESNWRYILRVNRYTGGTCLFDGGTQQVDDELLQEYIPHFSCEDIRWFDLYY